jgi:hypothetical protein
VIIFKFILTRIDLTPHIHKPRPTHIHKPRPTHIHKPRPTHTPPSTYTHHLSTQASPHTYTENTPTALFIMEKKKEGHGKGKRALFEGGKAKKQKTTKETSKCDSDTATLTHFTSCFARET